MKTIYSLLRYAARIYTRSNRFVMPFMAMLVFIGGVYAVMPVQVVDSYAFSASILFFIMVWMGMTYGDVEDPISEQLLALKTGGMGFYQLSGVLFLLGLCVFTGAIATVFPMLLNVAVRYRLYKTPATAGDIAGALMVHCSVGFMGASVGALFHPRLVKDRRIAMLLAFFVAIVGFVKIGIHRLLPAARAVTWLFPPVSEIAERFAGQAAFAGRDVAYAVLLSTLYGAVASGLKAWLLVRKKY